MKTIENKEIADKELLNVYDNIDGLLVIEELLLHKGEDYVISEMRVQKKLLEDMALIVYGLKSSQTNRLYVGFALDRYYKRADLVAPNGTIKVPIKIYEKVKTINDKYRNHANRQIPDAIRET